MGVSLVLLAIAGFFPVGAVLSHVLENRFPPWNPARGAPDGIVVLGGALDPALSQARGAPQLSGQAERITVVAKLAREFPKARIVYTAGNAALFPHAPAEADLCSAAVGELRHRARPRDVGNAFAQHLRKCRLHQGAGQAEAGLSVGCW